IYFCNVFQSSVFLLLSFNFAYGLDSNLYKSSEKTVYPKKATTLKKRPTKALANTNTTLPTKIQKSNKNIVEAFKDLSEDDLEFINELDKQFKVHGNKIKIKIEHDTAVTKNLKRTIDGELGYGFNYNGYEYSRPKFMFYPYSQNDIPRSTPNYYPNYDKTSVTIEPSYSYELKPQTYEAVDNDHAQIDLPHQHVHQQQQQSQQQYEEPIIVLRIPGPTKYASHIQALLQQYLEIRAAQYLHILKQQDLHKEQPYKQTHSQIQYYQPQVSLQEEEFIQPVQHHYHQALVKSQSQLLHSTTDQTPEDVSAPQSGTYPDIHDVYHTYKDRHQAEEPKQIVNYYKKGAFQAPTPQLTQQDKLPQYLYTSTKHYAQADNVHEYPMYVITMLPKSNYNEKQELVSQEYLHQQPIYIQDDKITEHRQAHQQNLHISENNPRRTHTKIIYTNGSENAGHDYVQYPLPSVRPFERIAPTSSAPHHQQYQQESEVKHNSEDNKQQDIHENTVAITQRPHNYHVHTRKMKLNGGHKQVTAVVDTQDDTNEKLEKIRSYVQTKFGAQTGSAIEYQTTA
ncbi:uncharacterized protein LOC119666193, partial [Teleopsis dalmanni]|uniref:uncharacterized protein LOC119666193 n=1 Tax=Teleopsis dalmanni TaxID=139649 RepID=UPI0018CD4CF8